MTTARIACVVAATAALTLSTVCRASHDGGGYTDLKGVSRSGDYLLVLDTCTGDASETCCRHLRVHDLKANKVVERQKHCRSSRRGRQQYEKSLEQLKQKYDMYSSDASSCSRDARFCLLIPYTRWLEGWNADHERGVFVTLTFNLTGRSTRKVVLKKRLFTTRSTPWETRVRSQCRTVSRLQLPRSDLGVIGVSF